jgi:hypothetical protein
MIEIWTVITTVGSAGFGSESGGKNYTQNYKKVTKFQFWKSKFHFDQKI